MVKNMYDVKFSRTKQLLNNDFLCEDFKMLLGSKNIFLFSSDFETLFTTQSPCKILGLNFEKKTVYSNCNFPI